MQGAPYSIFQYTPHAVRIHTKIGTVNIDFGGALYIAAFSEHDPAGRRNS